MRVIVLGCNGQLGRALADTAPATVEFTGLDLPQLDIADLDAVMSACETANPDVVVNAAAYTAVDNAESEPARAKAVNATGAGNAAAAAGRIGARLIQVSTDFVFDGESSRPYRAGDTTNPLSVYGITKRDGELAVLRSLQQASIVVRTAWLYSGTGNNFVLTMLRVMQEREELSVVADQVGAPTWAGSLADIIWRFADSTVPPGIYHWTDEGEASRYDFAVAVQEVACDLGLLERKIPIRPIAAEEYPTPARRPAYSVLDTSGTCAALDVSAVHWKDNLHKMLKGLAD